MGRRHGRRRRAALLVVLGLGIPAAVVTPGTTTPTAVGGPAAPVSPPEGTIPDLAALGWQPVLDEDFEGTSLDTSLWTRAQNPGYTIQGLWTHDVVSVGGGNLALATYTDANGQHHSGGVATGGLGQHNPTWNGFDATYGYVEARMLFPDGPDTSSTFWMMSSNGNNSVPFGDPASDGPELDIVEHANRPTSGPRSGDDDGDGRCDWPASSTVPCRETFIAGGHWDGFEEDHKAMHHDPVVNPDPSVSLQGNFHTYGLLWTPHEYRFFVDGIEVKRVTEGLTFQPEHILLHAYVRQDPALDFGPLGDPANDVTLVDHVRVWQRPVSDVPDQSTAATTPLAVPFTVQDHFFAAAGTPEPGVVTVEASSSNPTLVPNRAEHLAVSGNGPSDPDGIGPLEATDGSFDNGGFEAGPSGWTVTGTGTGVDSGPAHAGTQALHLPETGGWATQTITGLRPDTTYLVGGHHQIDLGFDDADIDGRVDAGETFWDPGDRTARFDWGIHDVDTAQDGLQQVRASHVRNGGDEALLPSWWVREPWPHELLKFTTGPTTTAVTLFVENISYSGQQDDSVVHVDSLYVRPLVNPQRTLTVHPAEGQVGEATITLTARDAGGTVIGTDAFDLTVGAGTLGDGNFEAGPATTPWEHSTGSPRLVVPDPFQADQQLELASTGMDTVTQTVTGLEPSTRYRVDVTGRVSAPGGAFAVAVQNHGGTQVEATVTSTTSTTGSVELVTGADVTSADLLVFDWVPADGSSLVEAVRLVKCATTASCTTLADGVPWSAPPDLVAVGPQQGVSSAPLTFGVHLPVGSTLTGVTSTNPNLVPDVGVAVTGPEGRKAVTVTPVQDQTGETSIRVAYTGAPGSPVDVPVVVSEAGLRQPGFEPGGAHWALSGSATTVTSGPRRGNRALRLDGAGDARQTVTGLPHATGLVLGGWIDGTATVALRTVPVEAGEQVETLATADWTGTGWTEQALLFTTSQCTACPPELWRPVEVVISDADPGDGRPVMIDDLHLVHRPVIRRQRDLSLHSQQTTFGWRARRSVAVGRVGENALWDPAVRSVSSADVPGFGTDVVPPSNLQGPSLPDHGWPYDWWLDVRAGPRTGRSEVTLTLTDPATGHRATETYAVTVNAGDNFDDGDFERSPVGALGSTGWVGEGTSDHEVTTRQRWQHLGIRREGSPYAGPRDDNRTLRISGGAVRHLVTGLAPGTSYTVKLRAKGDGSSVDVRTQESLAAPSLGSVAIAPPDGENVWRDYQLTFTTNPEGEGSTSVALYLVDASPGPRSSRPCALFAGGETCFDDIGIFRTGDLEG